MKLLTKELLKKLPKIGGQSKTETNETMLFVKLFTPWTQWTWYIAEYDPVEKICFGFVEGFEKEWGDFSLKELEEIRGPFGMKIERDIMFDFKKFSELNIG